MICSNRVRLSRTSFLDFDKLIRRKRFIKPDAINFSSRSGAHHGSDCHYRPSALFLNVVILGKLLGHSSSSYIKGKISIVEQTAKLNVGDFVRLSTGSADLKIIALNGEDCSVEWYHEGVRYDYILPQACVRKISLGLQKATYKASQ